MEVLIKIVLFALLVHSSLLQARNSSQGTPSPSDVAPVTPTTSLKSNQASNVLQSSSNVSSRSTTITLSPIAVKVPRNVLQSSSNVSSRSTTTTLSPIAVKATAEDRGTKFKLAGVTCATEDNCLFQLAAKISRPPDADLKSNNINVGQPQSLDDWCLPKDKQTSYVSCCKELLREINDKVLHASKESSLPSLLHDLNCFNVVCDEENCKYVNCKLFKCNQLSTSSVTSPASDVTTSTTDETSGTGDKDQRTTIYITIAVTCVVAFLAGLAAAFLSVCFVRRWRAIKRSHHCCASTAPLQHCEKRTNQHNGAETLDNTRSQPSGPTSMEEPDLKTNTYALDDSNYSTTDLRNAEHEYSSIADHQQTIHHKTTTTKPSATSYDNLPDNQFHDRKLPTAPALADAHSLADLKVSPDKIARAHHSEYPYTKRPESEEENCGVKVYRNKEMETSFSQENQRTTSEYEYFVLETEPEKRTQGEKSHAKEKTGSDIQRKSFSQGAAGQYFTLERENTPSHESETNARGSILSGLSDKGEYYSPLNVTSSHPEDVEYTALTTTSTENEDVEASRDYLDVLPDYLFSKPIS